MKWLQRLKTVTHAEVDATKATKPGFVGFVAYPVPSSEKFTAPQQSPANEDNANPDRWCWPRGLAMNTAELDTFTMRVARFTDKGLSAPDAEALADKLVKRDRTQDPRRVCMECAHAHGVDRWHCGNWHKAGLCSRASDAGLSRSIVVMLQHCEGFQERTR